MEVSTAVAAALCIVRKKTPLGLKSATLMHPGPLETTENEFIMHLAAHSYRSNMKYRRNAGVRSLKHFNFLNGQGRVGLDR